MGNLSVFPAFDYLTVTAGPNTMLYGKTIAVDDNDKSIAFRGSWSQAPQYPPSTPFDYTTRLYQNTAHWTSTIGDTMEFSFEGNLIFYITSFIINFFLQAAHWQSMVWSLTMELR